MQAIFLLKQQQTLVTILFLARRQMHHVLTLIQMAQNSVLVSIVVFVNVLVANRMQRAVLT